MKNRNKVTVITHCSCGSEILDLTYYKDDTYVEYYLTMYHSNVGMGLWWRFKNACSYFFNGEFEGNSIVLDKEEYNEFVENLTKHKRD